MQRRELDRDARPRRQRARCRRARRSRRSRRHRLRNSARRRPRCARPRPACRTSSGTRGASRRAPAPPRWSGRARNASRAAASPAASRRAPSAGRAACTRLSTMFSGVSPGWMMRAVMPSVQAEAETRNALELLRAATSRRRRACPRSAGRRSRRPARAAAPRPAPSGRGPPWWRANSRAGNPRCRRARRTCARIASTSRRRAGVDARFRGGARAAPPPASRAAIASSGGA